MGIKVRAQDGVEGVSYWFYCPGCGHDHRFTVRKDGGRPTWTFNGNLENPTFNPSLLMFVTNPETKQRKALCHLFLKNGVIEYLTDFDHAYKGKKYPLPDIA
jgi:hypothetical protein